MFRPQFSLWALLAVVAVPASAGAVIACLWANEPWPFILANFWLAFFLWIALRQTRDPTCTALGCLGTLLVIAFVLLLVAYRGMAGDD